MTLVADVRVRIGTLDVALELEAHEGEIVALLGPNGAGKSTTLRCLSGLLPIDGGRVVLDGALLDAPADGVFVPPQHRPVSVVFQEYLLFPHMTVLENVAFGLRARGRSAREARAAAHAWLEIVGLGDRARARPRELSGGQAQRVALARAMVTRPRLLLLDEPLAALDATTRGELRRDLRRHLAEVDGVRVLVTHDPVDASSLADRIVVLESGRVVQTGTLADVTAHPRTRYVADLVGINLVPGHMRDGALETDRGAVVVGTTAIDGAVQLSGPAFAAIRPASVALHRDQPSGSPRNVWSSVVVDIDHRADRVRVVLAGPVDLVAEITTGALVALGLRPGDSVHASVKASEVRIYSA